MKNSASRVVVAAVFAIFSVSLAIESSTPAFAERTGPGSTGGGNAVMTKDGVLRLIDGLSADEVKSIHTEAWDAYAIIKETDRFKFVGKTELDRNFFSCARKKIQDSDLFTSSQKELWLKFLDAVTVTRVLIPNLDDYKILKDLPLSASIATASYYATNGRTPLLPFAFSTKTPIRNQIPIAVYSSWISIQIYNPFYVSLTEEDQCGTQVHEAARIYADYVSGKPVTTDEVEALTQSIMGWTITDTVSYQSALTKLK